MAEETFPREVELLDEVKAVLKKKFGDLHELMKAYEIVSRFVARAEVEAWAEVKTKLPEMEDYEMTWDFCTEQLFIRGKKENKK
jgi:hypothetical protein